MINPKGLHYQNDLFLNLFIEKVLGFDLKSFGDILEVNVEESTNKNRRIDFTIKSTNYFIGIEMKVNAGDLKNQIVHYEEYLTAQVDGQKVFLYYLTKDGKDAPLWSKGGVDIRRVSFKKNILNWLDFCQDEVKNITNLNVALEDYKSIVKKITGTYKGNVVSIEEELLQDKKHLRSVLILDQKMNTIKGKVLYSFFKDIQEVLGKEFLDITNKMKDRDRVFSEKKCLNLYLNSRNKPKHFGVFFDCNFVNNLYFSVELHSNYLCYGILKLDDFTLIALEEKDKSLFNGISSVKNTRHVKKIGNTLLDDNILDFKNSILKDEILETINQIQERKI